LLTDKSRILYIFTTYNDVNHDIAWQDHVNCQKILFAPLSKQLDNALLVLTTTTSAQNNAYTQLRQIKLQCNNIGLNISEKGNYKETLQLSVWTLFYCQLHNRCMKWNMKT